MLTPRDKLIHGSWIIGILTIAVIVQASLKAAGDNDTATLIGVVTGLVSMVVGIIAIFYSFISNASLSETSARLHDSSTEIRKSVDLVVSNLKDIGSKVSDLHAQLPLVSQANQSSNSSPPKPSGQNITADQFANQLIDYFLATSSWLGVLTLYAAIERHRVGKPFNPYDWTNIIGGISPDYAVGYLVCAASIGMIEHDANRFLQQGNVVITNVLPRLRDSISQSVTTNLNRSGITPENATLRAQQKAQTDIYISKP